jgi:Protein of unknown function (DUF4231)
MTVEEFEVYRDGRYAKASRYYDRRAVRNQRCYHLCSAYVLVVSIAVTPVLLSDLAGKHGVALAAIMMPTVAVVAGLSDHFRFHENWLSSRATWDALQHELQWHTAGAGPYKGTEDLNAQFVERVEEIISREGAEWLARHAAKDRADSTVAPKV